MAYGNFIPTIWSAKLNEQFRKALVFGSVVNTDYEGELIYGNKVKINSLGDVTVDDYDPATGLSDPEELNGNQLELLIDQRKSFNFKVEDIDAVQANVNLLGKATEKAAYAMANVVDQFIASFYANAGNTIGDDTNPIVPTATDAYDYLVDMGVVLDENDVPEIDRFVIVPAWFYGLLLKDPRFTKDSDIISTGYVGDVDGMSVYKSNNVVNDDGANYKIIAGHESAISFAGQVESIEAYRPEKSFADAVKGLHVFGAKVIKPEGLVVMTADKA